ncbi:MAG: hypothetical protein JXR64_14075 [Spirochaetales bacterium]|nr:hypothetical protein [Spirochaetales bacterium]
MKKLVIVSSILIIFILLNFTYNAIAAEGVDAYIALDSLPKDAWVDILVKNQYIEFNNDLEIQSTIEEFPLYKYNQDGYIAANIRDEEIRIFFKESNSEIVGMQIIWGEYTPDDFAIIVQYGDNQLQVSNKVNYTSKRNFEEYYYDFSANTLIEGSKTRKNMSENVKFYMFLIFGFLLIQIILLAIEAGIIKMLGVKFKKKYLLLSVLLNILSALVIIYLVY